MLFKKMKSEKKILLMYFLPRILLSRIRNFIFSIAFKSNRSVFCEGLYFSGSKKIKFGNDVSIGRYCWFDAIDNGNIIIGDRVSFSQGVHIAAKENVEIKDDVLVGSYVLITDHDHEFSEGYLHTPPKSRPLKVKGKTVIESNVWLGDNVKVLSGSFIGECSVVAANSVVNGRFPSRSLIGGTPAKIIRRL